MPLTITPRPLVEPNNPYDKTLINLAISPLVQGDSIEGAMSLRLTPYRVLSDGRIDVAESLAESISSGAVFAEAATDPALAKAVTAIWTALQTYLEDKGI